MYSLWSGSNVTTRTLKQLFNAILRCFHSLFQSSMSIVRQVRRQEFPEGGSSTHVALRPGGLGAAQGPQKLWGIWNKILKSSNFQALHSNFRKVMFFKTDYMIFTKFYTNLSINLKKKTSTLIVLICFQGGSSEPLEPPPPPGYGCVRTCQFFINVLFGYCTLI